MNEILCVILGAAVGAPARYLAVGWVSRAAPQAFPWGTLAVNLLGCLVIGAAWGLMERALWAPAVRTFFFVGVLGSFTTFSSFGLETLQLFETGAWARALGYVAASNVGGLLLVWLGLAAARP